MISIKIKTRYGTTFEFTDEKDSGYSPLVGGGYAKIEQTDVLMNSISRICDNLRMLDQKETEDDEVRLSY